MIVEVITVSEQRDTQALADAVREQAENLQQPMNAGQLHQMAVDAAVQLAQQQQAIDNAVNHSQLNVNDWVDIANEDK